MTTIDLLGLSFPPEERALTGRDIAMSIESIQVGHNARESIGRKLAVPHFQRTVGHPHLTARSVMVPQSTFGTHVLRAAHISECVPGWERLIDGDDEAAVISRYGQPRDLGHRPALVVIDFQHAYLGEDVQIGEQLDRFPAGAGSGGWAAYRKALAVLAAARAAELPIIVTRVAFDPDRESDVSFAGKRSLAATLALGSPGVVLPAGLETQDGEHFITKSAASAFWGTDLDEFIAAHRIDSLFLVGLSTSGCVRATAVDAAARGLRTVIVADAVADRIRISHEVALLDIWMKYGELTHADELGAFLANRNSHERAVELPGRAIATEET